MRPPTFRATLLAFALMGSFQQTVRAGGDGADGLHFSYGDWEVACDNTRTCRAAGYQSDDDERRPVSVLLTRKAGPGAPVRAELQLGTPGDETVENWIGLDTLTMRINGKPVGTVALDASTGIAPLSPRQTTALIVAVSGSGRVDWTDGKRRWTLSGSGATAVLLKMDEAQGRLHTPGALVRKGSRDERAVLPPLAVPVVQAVAVPAQDAVELTESALRALRAELAAGLRDCPRAESDGPADGPAPELDVRRLSATKLLVSTSCWMAAYNTGDAYWVVNTTSPYAPELITQHATDYADGRLGAVQKGRGIADCVSQQEWTWNGRRFAATRQETSGKCKSVAPGGAWSLPTLVTAVRPPR